MAWYWWVLVGVVAGFVGYVKIRILTRIMSRARKDSTEKEEP